MLKFNNIYKDIEYSLLCMKKEIYTIRIDKQKYIIDDYLFRRIRRLRNSICNMKKTIINYTERIEVKKKFLDEVFDEVKRICPKD